MPIKIATSSMTAPKPKVAAKKAVTKKVEIPVFLKKVGRVRSALPARDLCPAPWQSRAERRWRGGRPSAGRGEAGGGLRCQRLVRSRIHTALRGVRRDDGVGGGMEERAAIPDMRTYQVLHGPT